MVLHDEFQATLIAYGMYATGQGVSQDYAEALKWYRKATEQGLAEAQLNLGLMYYNGWGTRVTNGTLVW